MESKIKRDNLKVGDDIMTKGTWDNVELDKRVGKILKIGEYGNLLVEFDESFSKELHSGYKNIGKPKHCFYIPLANVLTNDKSKFEELKKRSSSYYVDDKQWWFANRPKSKTEEAGKTGKATKKGSY